VFALAGLLLGLFSLRQVKTAQPGPGAHVEPFFLRLLPLFALATLIYVVMFMGSTQFAFLLQEDGIRDPATRSLIMSMVTVLATLTSFAYGWIQQRLGLRGAFLLGLACATASLTAIGLGESAASAIAGASLLGVFVGLGAPYVYHIVAERTDAHTRGRAMGMVSAFGFFGAFLNPVILAPLGRAVGIHGSFLVVAAVMALFAVATYQGLRRRPLTAL
jgi:MFS family permease